MTDNVMAIKSWDIKRVIKQLIIIAFGFGFKYLPPFGEMTQFGMGLLGIFIAAIFGWIALDMEFTNLVIILATCFCGLYGTCVETFQGIFGVDMSVLVLGCLFVSAFIESTDLTDVIIGYLLNLKIAKKNTLLFFFFFYFAVWLVAAVSAAIVTIHLFVVMYRDMAEKAKIAPYSRTNSYILCGIGLIAVLGEISFPFKPTVIAIFTVVEGFLGYPVTMIQYLLYCTTFQIFFIAVYVLLGKFVFRAELSKFSAVDVKKISPDKKQKVGLICIAIMLTSLLMTSTTVWPFSYLKSGGVIIAVLVMMMFIQVDRKPLMSLQQLAGKFNWPLYLTISCFYPVCSQLANPDVGITDTIRVFLAPILTNLPPFVFFIMAMLLTTLITNFLNNWPVAVIFISIMFSVGGAMGGLNLAAATMAIYLAAFAACATPAANPSIATVFAHKDLIEPKKTITIGFITAYIFCLMSIFIYYPILSFLM